ncbi:hypothetical protein MATR_01640 [Marivirga tractuosa]|uniref:Macrocin-O-methyltransferase n=1 Tax=Marivirga tractuosa (strain ATCC 23168 / DSM 4126 / NBRC 15989 / NCIMB 1408 / VKM B-1430 / H-43) TaxID=643867 RepID=E4TVU7_MARTH|nr:TylF/MycF/NovP-related O-methyltransferase [Marivirga tractuosa]ADR22195.1 hypothetical protein Ftrac_2215 [Marivirga tractuosa DSM 4126]BDD13339.1 hypothetical protein MATR_01640 [Marivirga tractuosa]
MSQSLRNKINSLLLIINIQLIRVKPIEKIADKLFNKYRQYTMVPLITFKDNLTLIEDHVHKKDGIVVECGVWRGGMAAAIGEILPNKKFFLFDSFEGLPEVQEIDGKAANEWQSNKESIRYRDNCKAEMYEAETAMKKARANFQLVKGWFNQTLPDFKFDDKIDLLRLDGDWYDSTMDCFVNLYPKVKKGGLIIIDDYFAWDGCSRATHDYLSQIKSESRIQMSKNGVCYIIKKD